MVALKARFFEHVERPAEAALGVRVVEYLMVAYNKDAPPGWGEVAIYRPMDQEAYVYKLLGGWDYRPLTEFLQRYRAIDDEQRVGELQELSRKIYDPWVWLEYRMENRVPIG